MNYLQTVFILFVFLTGNVTFIHSQSQNNTKIVVSDNAEQFISGFNSTNKSGKQVLYTTVQVSPEETLTLDFNVRKQKGEMLKLLGSVNQERGSYYNITYLNGKVEGEISLKNKNRAYIISSSPDSKVYIEEIKQSDIDYFLDFTKLKASSSKKGEKKSIVISGRPPTLQSRPGASGGVIYLDFDGEVVEDSNWNLASTNTFIATDVNPINAQPAPYNDGAITSIWEVMAEDFSPFDLNVTTDRSVYNATPVNRRLMVIFTPTKAAIGNGFAAGVARGRSFRNNSDDPVWVFTPQPPRSAGQVGSHEVGHAMSLDHDGQGSTDEYAGHGDWSPIMGLNTPNPTRHWSRGEYTNASNTQDDIDRIANDPNFVGFAPDDHGNTINGATALIADTGGNVSSTQNSGIIEQRTDLDMFSFVSATGEASFTVNQFQYSAIPRNANLDIRLRLLDANGSEIAVSNPSGPMNATITHNITTAGTYYLEIDGVGRGNVNNGYSDYGSLGQFSISGSYVVGTPDTEAPADVTGLMASNITSTSFNLSWTATTDNVAVTGYEVLVDGASQGMITGLSDMITGLMPATSYTISVIALDAAGNMSTPNVANEITVLTLPAPGADTEAPTAVTALTAMNVGSDVYTISWMASTDNVGVTGYNVLVDGVLHGTTSNTSYEITGLSSPPYTISVIALDAAGNESMPTTTTITSCVPSVSADVSIFSGQDAVFTITGQVNEVITYSGAISGTVTIGAGGTANVTVSNVTSDTDIGFSSVLNCGGSWAALRFITVIVQSNQDSTPPAIVGNVRFSFRSPFDIDVSWDPSADNVGVTGYNVFVNGVLNGTTSDTSYSITGLLAGANYTISVIAVDAAGNKSDCLNFCN